MLKQTVTKSTKYFMKEDDPPVKEPPTHMQRANKLAYLAGANKIAQDKLTPGRRRTTRQCDINEVILTSALHVPHSSIK